MQNRQSLVSPRICRCARMSFCQHNSEPIASSILTSYKPQAIFLYIGCRWRTAKEYCMQSVLPCRLHFLSSIVFNRHQKKKTKMQKKKNWHNKQLQQSIHLQENYIAMVRSGPQSVHQHSARMIKFTVQNIILVHIILSWWLLLRWFLLYVQCFWHNIMPFVPSFVCSFFFSSSFVHFISTQNFTAAIL